MLGDVIRGFLFVVVTLGGLFGALGVVVGLVERDMEILVVYLVWSVVFAILGALVFWWIKSSRSPTKRGVGAGRLSAYPPGSAQAGVSPSHTPAAAYEQPGRAQSPGIQQPGMAQPPGYQQSGGVHPLAPQPSGGVQTPGREQFGGAQTPGNWRGGAAASGSGPHPERTPKRPDAGTRRPQDAPSGAAARPGELSAPPGGLDSRPNGPAVRPNGTAVRPSNPDLRPGAPDTRPSAPDARTGAPNASKPAVDERHSAPTKTAGPVRRSDVGAPLTPPPVRPGDRPPVHSPSADTYAEDPARRSSPVTPPARPVAPSDPTVQQSFPDEH